MDSWRFVLADRGFTPIGEIINATSRKVANPLSKFDTASLQVRLDNPLADALMSCEGYLKAYRNNFLRFMGPLISAEESVDSTSQSIAVNAVGAGWVLTRRLAGKSANGTAFATLTDRAQIIDSLIAAANAEGETGIRSSGTNFAASAVTYVAGPYRPVSEVLTELATAVDGFDWRMMPVENVTAGVITGQKIAEFLARDVIGGDASGAVVFEYGDGRHNIESYKRTVNREQQANKVYHLAGSTGASTPGLPAISAIDTASISNWGLLEDLAQADLVDPAMRQQLVDEHVRVRRNPRQVIEFSPVTQLGGDTRRVPQVGTDFDVGDFIRARAVYNRRLRFDAAFRVYGVSFEIDDLNNEKAMLTLAEES